MREIDDISARMATLAGTAADDELDGTQLADLITGLGGDDILDGNAGDDTLDGGNSDDALFGGSGDDFVAGGSGLNALSGGSGDDTLLSRDPSEGGDIVDGGSGFDMLSLVEATAGVEIFLSTTLPHLRSIEGAIGSAFADSLGGGEIFYGEGGDDTMDASGDDIVLSGGAGNDDLGLFGNGVGYGEAGNDRMTGDGTLRGGAGDDTISGLGPLVTGGVGDDSLSADWVAVRTAVHGGSGDDTLAAIYFGADLYGGEGRDVFRLEIGPHTVAGGAGRDSFNLRSFSNRLSEGPTITDLDDADRISLRKLDADTSIRGNQAFRIVDSLTTAGAEAVFAYDAGADVTRLLLSTDRDADAEVTCTLLGEHDDFANVVL